jgi:hypothetical protein
MDSIISVLKDTPIPTILVVSGIVFLFLALAGQIAGKLEVPPARQKWSALAGAVLLSVGLLLYLTPERSQGQKEEGSASPVPAVSTQSIPIVQPTSVQSVGALPTLSGGVASPVLGEGEKCFEDIFSGISADRIKRIEIGGGEDELLNSRQSKDDPAGIIITDLGQPVLALTFIFFEDNTLFKIVSVVDAACQPVDYINASRGGQRDALQNRDILEVTTGTGVYYLRFGYSSGAVSVSTSKTLY